MISSKFSIGTNRVCVWCPPPPLPPLFTFWKQDHERETLDSGEFSLFLFFWIALKQQLLQRKMAIKRVFLLPPSPTTTIKRALQAVISFLFPSHPPFLQGVGWVVFYTAYGKVFWASVPSLIAHRSPIKKTEDLGIFSPCFINWGRQH